MATMKSKLDGKAEVVRRLDSEKRLIKSISEHLVDSKVQGLSRLYEVVVSLQAEYGEQEIRKLVDVCLRQSGLRQKAEGKTKAKTKAKTKQEGV